MKASNLFLRTLPAAALFACGLGLGSARADDPRDRAIADYNEAARKEMAAYHAEIDSGRARWDTQHFGEIKARLDECDKRLARLRSASPEEFDQAKAQYEQSRARLTGDLRNAGR